MTNKEILEKAIQKAMDNGFDLYDHDKWYLQVVDDPFKTEKHSYKISMSLGHIEHVINYEKVIFDHDFAKALWGNTEFRTDYTGTCGNGYSLNESWYGHLQNMVVSDDPIKYLGDNI